MIDLKQILNSISYVKYEGNLNLYIEKPVQADSNYFDSNTITWISKKNSHLFKKINKGVIICDIDSPIEYKTCTYILTKNPRLAFSEILSKFFVKEEKPYISKSSIIHSSVSIGQNVTIDDFVVIEEGSKIGNFSKIGAGSIIKRNTIIGNNVIIGCNNTIGGVGFGYEKNEKGNYGIIPHIGNVVIKNQVEIGNNTCIDRAVLGSTIINENVKIDNLVHISHGVIIGANSLIIANSMIAGSSIIGEDVWISPSSSILNKKCIGNNSVIGMGAVVLKDVKEGQIIIGNPGKELIKK